MNKSIFQILKLFWVLLLVGCASKTATTSLIDATSQNDVTNIEELVKSGADLNEEGGRHGETALMVASRKGNFALVKLLISKGADINARGTYGDTALIAAAWTCQLEVAQYLIEKGAEVNAKNDVYGSTALNIAAGKCHDIRLVRLLLDNGADLHIRNKGGDSPFFSAAKDGDPSIVNMLLKAGANINEINRGYTALMFAVMRGNEDVVSLLIDKKIDINARNNSGKTALDIAKDNRKSGIVELLKKAGATETPKKWFDLKPGGYMPLPR